MLLFGEKSDTLYSANKNISQIISDISNGFETLTKWFYGYYMILNPDKCHSMTLGFQDHDFDFHYDNVVITKSAEKKKKIKIKQ